MADKGQIFRELHRPGDPVIMANAWDAGSAKMLLAMGAKCVATSSAAHAFTLGQVDGTVDRDQAMAHAEMLVSAVNVPVSGDFENGFGEAPETCAETVRMAAEIGLAGICIEDTALPGNGAYEFDLAVDRIRAAAAAARALPGDFVLTARADGVLLGSYDTDEAHRRLMAFEDAGADCLYAPMPQGIEAMTAICRAAKVPVNVLSIGAYADLSRVELGLMGVGRISLGSTLARVTYQAIYEAGQELFDRGRFDRMKRGLPFATLDPMLGDNG